MDDNNVVDCPLSLQPFSTVDISGLCPVYLNKVAGAESIIGAASLDFDLPPPDQIKQLSEELKLIQQSAVYRGKQAADEVKKAEEFIKKENVRLQSLASTLPPPYQQAPPAQTVPTIKLKLKDFADDKKIKQASHVKRQREDDDASSIVSGSVVTADTKRSRTDAFEKQGSQEPPEFTAIPGDTVKIKPSQQVTSQTFWNYVDAYFRLINQDDVKFLDPEADDPFPFIIPPLGRHYHEVWAEEERALLPGSKGYREDISLKSKKSIPLVKKDSNIDPSLVEEQSELVDTYSGGLVSERLVSSLLEDKESTQGSEIPEIDHASDQGDFVETITYKDPNKEEVYTIEQRLKRELKFLGLFDSDDESDKEKEDEITLEMRRLQNDLRKVTAVNKERKEILKEKATERLAYQEYCTIMTEMEKQIEQLFLKRLKIFAKKQQRKRADSNGAQKPYQPSEILADDSQEAPKINVPAVVRRKKLIIDFEPIFPPSKFYVPNESIFKDDAYLWLSQVSMDPINHKEIIDELEKIEASKKGFKNMSNIKLVVTENSNETVVESVTSTALAGSTAKSKKADGDKSKKKQPAKPRKKKDPTGESVVDAEGKPKKKRVYKKKPKIPDHDSMDQGQVVVNPAMLAAAQQLDLASPASSTQDLTFLSQPGNGGYVPDWMYTG